MEYTLLRSARQTLAVEILRGGNIIVRAPYKMRICDIEQFLISNEERILKASQKAENAIRMYSDGDKEAEMLRRKANAVIPQKVEFYSNIMHVKPKSLRITGAKKRFGSCSSSGSVCFSFNLMQYPDDVIDYVVVHELAHLIELNHGANFWKIVASYIPDYKQRRTMLKK